MAIECFYLNVRNKNPNIAPVVQCPRFLQIDINQVRIELICCSPKTSNPFPNPVEYESIEKKMQELIRFKTQKKLMQFTQRAVFCLSKNPPSVF